jgi:guanylate kinase
MTPGEFSNLTPEMRKGCFVVYLDIDRKVRESRLLGRQDKNDSITRRLDADDIDFQSYNDYDLKITDPEFSSDDVYDLMD